MKAPNPRKIAARKIAARQTAAPKTVVRPPSQGKALRLRSDRPSEAQIQSAVMRRLRVAGFLVVRVNSGGFKDATGRFVKGYIVQGLNSCSGFPDVLALKNGRALLLELKNHKNKLTDSQERFADYAAHFGVAVHVVRHPDELDAILEANQK